MQINRLWFLPDFAGPIPQVLERPEGWGQSLMWYCFRCGEVYAKAIIDDRPYVAISGCCFGCVGNCYSIPGSIDTIKLINEELPLEVLGYQLRREIRFLDHPDHPYNKEI